MEHKFVAVDNNRFGTGLTDTNTKSLSTYLENRINNNTECLIGNSHCVGRTLSYGNARNGRTVCSLYPVSIFVGVIDVMPNTSKIEVDVAGLSIGGPVYIDTWVHEWRGGRPVPIGYNQRKVINTPGDGSVTSKHVHELPRNSFVGSKLVVSVFVKSNSIAGSLQNRFWHQIQWTDTEQTLYDGFRWSSGTWDNFGQNHFIRDEDSGREWQPIAHHTVTGKGGAYDGDWTGLQPLNGTIIYAQNNGSVVDNYYSKRAMTQFVPEGVFVSVERDPDVGTFFQGRKQPDSMWAQYPVLGQHVSQHVINMDAEYGVYRVQAAGNGLIPQHDSTWSSAYTYTTFNSRPNWPYRSGGPGGDALMDTLTVDIDHSTTRLEVSGLMLGFEVHSIWTSETDFPGYPPTPNAIERYSSRPGDQNALYNPTTQASDSIRRIVGNIPVRIRLSQLQNGDLNVAGATYIEDFDFEQQVQFWRTTPDHTRPLLRQLDFMWHNDVFTNDRTDIRAEYRATQKWGNQEGRLSYFNGLNEMIYLTPFSFTLTPTGFDPDLPLQCEIYFGGTDKTDYYSTISEPVTLDLFDSNDDGVPDLNRFVDERCKVALVTWSLSTRGVL